MRFTDGDTATSVPRWPLGERGAVVVETALMLPILLVLLFGIIEFGRLYNAQLTLTHAAREGIREYVITGDAATAASTARAAVPGIAAGDLDVAITDSGGGPVSGESCDPVGELGIGDAMTLTISYTDFVGFIPLWGDLNDIDLEATGTMRCGG